MHLNDLGHCGSVPSFHFNSNAFLIPPAVGRSGNRASRSSDQGTRVLCDGADSEEMGCPGLTTRIAIDFCSPMASAEAPPSALGICDWPCVVRLRPGRKSYLEFHIELGMQARLARPTKSLSRRKQTTSRSTILGNRTFNASTRFVLQPDERG